MARVMTLGKVKTFGNVTMGNPQPSPYFFFEEKKMDAVNRLDVGGFWYQKGWGGFRFWRVGTQA
jgi:hypothetical protein